MKNVDLSKFLKNYLIPDLGNDYKYIKGNILYKKPIDDILLGFCFESSGYERDGFFLWVFAQPLYIPSEDFDLTFGKRLVGKSKNEFWKVSGDNLKKTSEELINVIKKDGISYLEKISTPNSFSRFFKKDKSGSLRVLEAIIYSEFYSLTDEANIDAVKFIKRIKEKEDLSINWINEILHNLESLIEARIKSKDRVQLVFRDWMRITITNLGI